MNHRLKTYYKGYDIFRKEEDYNKKYSKNQYKAEAVEKKSREDCFFERKGLPLFFRRATPIFQVE